MIRCCNSHLDRRRNRIQQNTPFQHKNLNKSRKRRSSTGEKTAFPIKLGTRQGRPSRRRLSTMHGGRRQDPGQDGRGEATDAHATRSYVQKTPKNSSEFAAEANESSNAAGPMVNTRNSSVFLHTIWEGKIEIYLQ